MFRRLFGFLTNSQDEEDHLTSEEEEEEQSISSDEEETTSTSAIFYSPHTQIENSSKEGDWEMTDYHSFTVNATTTRGNQSDCKTEFLDCCNSSEAKAEKSPVNESNSATRIIDFNSPNVNFTCKGDSFIEDCKGDTVTAAGRDGGSSSCSDCLSFSEVQEKERVLDDERRESKGEVHFSDHFGDFDSPIASFSCKGDTFVKEDNVTAAGRSDSSSNCSDCLSLSEAQEEERVLDDESRESKGEVHFSDHFGDFDSPIASFSCKGDTFVKEDNVTSAGRSDSSSNCGDCLSLSEAQEEERVLDDESRESKGEVHFSDHFGDFDSPIASFSCKGDTFVKEDNVTAAGRSDSSSNCSDCLSLSEAQEEERVLDDESRESKGEVHFSDHFGDFDSPIASFSCKGDTFVKEDNVTSAGRSDSSSNCGDCLSLSEAQEEERVLDDESRESKGEVHFSDHFGDFDSPIASFSCKGDTFVKEDNVTAAGRSDSSSNCSDCLSLSEAQEEERVLDDESRESKGEVHFSDHFGDFDSPIASFSCKGDTFVKEDNVTSAGRSDSSSNCGDCLSLSEAQEEERVLDDESRESKGEVHFSDHFGDFDSPIASFSCKGDTFVKEDNVTAAGRSDSSSNCSDCLSLSEAQEEERVLDDESRESKGEVHFSDHFGDSPVRESGDDNSLVIDSPQSSSKTRSPSSFVHRNTESISSRLKVEELIEEMTIEMEKRKNKEKEIGKYNLEQEDVIVISDDDEDHLISSTCIQSAHNTCTSAESGKDIEDDEPFVLNGANSQLILPGRVARMLYPHQISGLRWLWSLHSQGKGGILGDDMGLGKTMQICSFLAGLFHSKLVQRVLIVAPGTLLSQNWVKELTTVGLLEKTREYKGLEQERKVALKHIIQKTGLLLVTYGIVTNHFKSLIADERSKDGPLWDYVILDEGHMIKNPDTQRAKSLHAIPSNHRILVTGTPLQNHLKELWALFSYCCPQLLGDKLEFKERFEKAILRGNNKNATNKQKRIGSTAAKALREHIEPYFLRRLKSEVEGTSLSSKNELIVWLRLTQLQRQLYEAFLKKELVISSFDEHPLVALMVLKKLCDHPYLLKQKSAEDVVEGMETKVDQDKLGLLQKMALDLASTMDQENLQNLFDNLSCKITFILSLLGNLIPDGHHVLIFSQSLVMLNILQEAIVTEGYEYVRIDGTIKISDREKTVNDFQNGKGAPIFLLTSQVGGLGLTLTKADRVIIVDPHWNPSTDDQSVDRAYRIGQKKDVIVYRLMTCGTIEEKIYQRQIFKGGLFKSATEPKELTKYFSEADLWNLLSLPKDGFDVSVTHKQLEEEHGQDFVMTDSLKKHIEFLNSHDIAGVSHHSLLYSKTPVLDEDEV